jgi:hypothetical protein
MKFSRIQELSELIPEDSKYANLLGSSDSRLNKFAQCYKDLAFGWNFVRSLENKSKPPTVTENFLVRAYNYLFNNARDPKLQQAEAYASTLSPYYKDTINSLLFVDNITVGDIAKKLGVDTEIIRLYEKLFFNILDRKEEYMFITSLVYPEGRLEEMDPKYADKVCYGTLAKRAAFNNGSEDALVAAGFPSSFMTEGTAEDNSTRLESAMMANAYWLMRNGFGNSRNSIGLNNAKNLIAAAKHGGQEDTGEAGGVGVAAIGTILLNEVRKHQEGQILKRLEHEKDQNELSLREAERLTGEI